MSTMTVRHPSTSFRVAALAAASLLVLGLLASSPAVGNAAPAPASDLSAELCPDPNTSTTVTLTGPVTDASGTVTLAANCVAVLDLNGHAVEVKNVVLGAGSDLTVRDTSEDRNGSLTASEGIAGQEASGGSGSVDASALTISGGTVNAWIKARTVTISGGTVNATGQDYAGIGGSALTISGGTVNAIGDMGYAGISSSTVTITAGMVNATGGFAGAGIGGDPGVNGGTVTISGGTVIAITGRFGAAGIGGGTGGDGGTVTISGGEVTATGDEEAEAIGAGDGETSSGDLFLGAGAVRVNSVESNRPVTRITFVPVVNSSTPSGPSFFAPGGVQPSQQVASAAFVRADGSPQRLTASVPGRDQVRYEADGVSVTLQGGPGTDVARGLVANPAGEIVCEVCITGLAAGQVVEVWLFSTPRLVAAHLTDDAECQLFTVPLSSPLDGGGPVAAGAHTLQFTVATSDGLEAVNVGLTVGGLVPTSVPAGEGPVTPYALVALMLVVLLGIRRAAVTRA